MFLPPRVRSTRPKSRHAQRSATLNARPLRLLQAKPFSFAATKISIGRRSRCRYGILQAKPFSFAATKIGRVNSARKKNEDSRTAALIVIYQDIA